MPQALRELPAVQPEPVAQRAEPRVVLEVPVALEAQRVKQKAAVQTASTKLVRVLVKARTCATWQKVT